MIITSFSKYIVVCSNKNYSMNTWSVVNKCVASTLIRGGTHGMILLGGSTFPEPHAASHAASTSKSSSYRYGSVIQPACNKLQLVNYFGHWDSELVRIQTIRTRSDKDNPNSFGYRQSVSSSTASEYKQTMVVQNELPTNNNEM